VWWRDTPRLYSADDAPRATLLLLLRNGRAADDEADADAADGFDAMRNGRLCRRCRYDAAEALSRAMVALMIYRCLMITYSAQVSPRVDARYELRHDAR